MTTTDIGVLLIVLCVLLWAIMAALHRHTVQLEALQRNVEALRNAHAHASARTAGRPGLPDENADGTPRNPPTTQS